MWDTTTVSQPRHVLGRIQNDRWASPGFPVDLVGADELHAAFLNESRTRGRWWHPVAGNPGSPIVFVPRTLVRTWGTRPIYSHLGWMDYSLSPLRREIGDSAQKTVFL
jgi:hypothetical protein